MDTHGFVQVIHLYLLTAVLSDITATEVYLPMEDSSIIMIMRNIFLYHRSELFKSFLRVFYFTFLSFLVLEISIHCVVHYNILIVCLWGTVEKKIVNWLFFYIFVNGDI